MEQSKNAVLHSLGAASSQESYGHAIDEFIGWYCSKAAAQARRCFEIIQSAIEGLGGKLSDVLRTRILLTRIQDWEQVAAVHGKFFGSIRHANTIMQVVCFIDPDWLVEIEADAIVEDQSVGAVNE